MLALLRPNELKGVEAMKRENPGLKGILIAAALTVSAAVSAQQVTYDFTGTITSSNLGWVSAGTTVSGTYTFNLGNADPGLSDNGINQYEPWSRDTAGGSLFSYLDTSPQTGSVFSSSIRVGTPAATTFADSGLSAIGNLSSVLGGAEYYSASVTDYTSTSSFVASNFSLTDLSQAPFGTAGLPVLGMNTTGTGVLEFVSNYTPGSSGYTEHQLDYSITSLSRVAAPEINSASAASGLTLLFGGLAVLCGRRKAAA